MPRLRGFLIVPVAVALALAALAAPAHAMTFRTAPNGGAVVIGPNETVDDDVYASGNAVDIRGTVHGTVYAAGNTVSVVGSVTGDVWAAGNSVSIGGDVGHSVHAAGNQVTVDGRVGDDIAAAGQTLTLGAQANGGRDAALAGNGVLLAGRLGRNLFVGANTLTVSGSVGGDLTANVSRMSLTNGSSVQGNVRYTSDNAAQIANGATVGGRVVRSFPQRPERPSPAAQALLAFTAWLRRLIGLLLFGLIVVPLFPLFVRHATERIRVDPLPSLGIGLAILVLVPVSAMMAFVIGLLVGGWWIALFELALYVIAIAVATIVSAVFLGRWIIERVSHPRAHDLLALLVGLFALTLLEAVPVLGVLVRIAEVLFGLGAVALALVRPRQAMGAPPAATGPG
jgi:cytoskeletal protein CcmA (bactofilin family)